MKNFLFLLVSLSFSFKSFSQHEADNWYYGLNCGITFATNPPSFLPGSVMVTGEGCASISDHSGNLLFYSNGERVYDRNHITMPNGSGLNGSTTCSQSALIIPLPGSDSIYYLFNPPDEFGVDTFRYSIIDMSLNNGNGAVTVKNFPLFTPSTEKVTAVQHSNGIDSWIIGHSFNNADFYAYTLTSLGVNPVPVISTAGAMHTGFIGNNIGIMKASPCGDKIALTVSYDEFAELFDFDNSTGIVSNAIHLGDFAFPNSYGVYGIEFSPDGSRLYVTQENPALLVQYNLLAGSAAAIVASADTIVFWPTKYFGTLQNGPDGKMYISRFHVITPVDYISCLNNPDSLGTSCNFTDTAVMYTSGSSSHGLPNFLTSYFCGVNTGVVAAPSAGLITSIYPSPTQGEIQIKYKLKTSMAGHIELSDMYGQTIEVVKLSTFPLLTANDFTEITFDLKNYPSGIYFVKIMADGKSEIKKVVKL